MENIEISNAIGRFLKDGSETLSNPIIEICNLSISDGIFPNAWKVSKLKPTFEKRKKLTHLIKDLSRYYHWFHKSLKR